MSEQETLACPTDYCLARAEESERMAAEAVDENNKAIFMHLAWRWRQLASESNSGVSNRLQRRPPFRTQSRPL